MKVGILALQGSFAEHEAVLRKLKQEFVLVKTKQDLKGLTHLIIPGGESTTLEKLLRKAGMWEGIEGRMIHSTGSGQANVECRIESKKLKIFGTCAGAIILAKLGMDIEIERNGYGSQQDSFEAELESEMFSELQGIFIRAPKFKVGKMGIVLANFNDQPVLVEQDNFLVCSFHPELIGETRIHKYFLKK